MSTLPSNPNDIQAPPTRIEPVRAGPRSSARSPLAQDVIRPSTESEQLFRRSDDLTPASVGPTSPESPLTVSASEVPHACALDHSNFFTRNIEPRPEVIGGLIREGQLEVLAGTYGVGKSPLLAHIQICVLNGIAWCGREVQRRPIIGFDSESSGPTYRRNLLNLADRLRVSVPRVPEDLDAYLQQDSFSEPSMAKLLELLKFTNLEAQVTSLTAIVARRPNALIIIDPLELLFSIDTRDKRNVIDLYSQLKKLLAIFPRAAILFTVNLRKKDRRAQYTPSLLTDPRDWLEDVSGSLDILNRCDLRLGMDFYDADGLRVINGIRRGEDMHPILIRPVCVNDEPDRPAGFEHVPADHAQLLMTLTHKLQEYWQGLPAEFTFEQAIAIMGKSNFKRLKNLTISLAVLEQVARGRYRKISGPVPSER
jgi:hypothetical protein